MVRTGVKFVRQSEMRRPSIEYRVLAFVYMLFGGSKRMEGIGPIYHYETAALLENAARLLEGHLRMLQLKQHIGHNNKIYRTAAKFGTMRMRNIAM